MADLMGPILSALKSYMADHGVVVYEVISADDGTEWSGGCESCGYDMAVVYVAYREIPEGRVKSYTVYSGFADLITELSKY